jgi:hypothetical protein
VQWPRRGPLTREFRAFLANPHTRAHNKVTIVAYVSIFIAFAVAWPMAAVTCARAWPARFHHPLSVQQPAVRMPES